MFEFWFSSLHTVIRPTVLFDFSNTSYYVEVENDALLHAVVENDHWRSWKIVEIF